ERALDSPRNGGGADRRPRKGCRASDSARGERRRRDDLRPRGHERRRRDCARRAARSRRERSAPLERDAKMIRVGSACLIPYGPSGVLVDLGTREHRARATLTQAAARALMRALPEKEVVAGAGTIGGLDGAAG